jgi:hypothetical protein
MAEHGRETAQATRELITLLGELDRRFTEGDRALDDEASVLEGYRWMFSILRVGLDVYLWADPDRPRFVDIVGPYKKWGGDNVDAFYQFAPIDPRRTYRVSGVRGDAVYFSLTVYGGPSDGRYTERIVGIVNDRMLDVPPDGRFSFVVSPHEHPQPWLKLEPDAVHAITRDYLADPRHGRRMSWQIECLDGAPAYRPSDADTARRLRAVATWLREQAQMVPVPIGAPNAINEPYPVPKVTYGWAAGDLAYAMGFYELTSDEALVIRGRSPQTPFWNVCLWNPFLHTYNYDYDCVSLNGTQIQYEQDGSWTIVVAGEDPGRANWIATQGHGKGLVWFRWIYPSETPARPTTEVVKLAALRAGAAR